MPKYKCKFTLALQKEFPFLKLKVGTESEVSCEICCSQIKIANSGRKDIKAHIKTAKHLKALVRSNRTLDSVVTNKEPLSLPAKELTFANHAGKHWISNQTS